VSTQGEGNGGQLFIKASDAIEVTGDSPYNSNISAEVTDRGVGDGGSITIETPKLSVQNGGQIISSTLGRGDSGDISITAENSISLNASSYILNNVQSSDAVGDAGKIDITTGSLSATNGSQIDSFTRGRGNAGDITIQATDSVTFDGVDSNDNYSSSFSSVEAGANGDGGDINITARSLSLTNGGQLEASVFGETDNLPGGVGQGGNVTINVDDTLTIAGETTNGIFANLGIGAVGSGGKIDIQAGNLVVKDGGQINSFTRGRGNAGEITIQASDAITFDDSLVATGVDTGAVGNGGNINITAKSLSLTNGGQIDSSTSGRGDSGDVTIRAIDAVTFDGLSSTNNVLTGVIAGVETGAVGDGGNITLDTPAYFAENFTLNSLTSNPATLNNNFRADLNATGAVSGVVSIPDVSFIQNSLNNLPDNSINTDELVANSCVSPVGKRQEGKFIITGTGGLPDRPGNGSISDFATGEVRNVPSNNSGWHRGEPIVEPQGVYRLTNGKLVMSRECHSQ
jgi:large exoprotein involved in heme utilization and adhesion